MDAMVSARVPAEVKKHGDRLLKEIGSSTTELVNAAYAYLLEHGCLPKGPSPEVMDAPQTKTLGATEAKRLHEQWGKRAILSGAGYDGENFRELLDQARGDYFARFA